MSCTSRRRLRLLVLLVTWHVASPLTCFNVGAITRVGVKSTRQAVVLHKKGRKKRSERVRDDGEDETEDARSADPNAAAVEARGGSARSAKRQVEALLADSADEAERRPSRYEAREDERGLTAAQKQRLRRERKLQQPRQEFEELIEKKRGEIVADAESGREPTESEAPAAAAAPLEPFRLAERARASGGADAALLPEDEPLDAPSNEPSTPSLWRVATAPRGATVVPEGDDLASRSIAGTTREQMDARDEGAARAGDGEGGVALVAAARAFLVGVDLTSRAGRSASERAWSVGDSLDELARLCETADLEPVGATFQRLGRVDGYTFVGSGKVAEIAANARALDASFVVFDDELSFSQQRNLQREFARDADAQGADAPQVLDRTQLILEIFSRRARTKEAKMQVELAKAEYMLPRLQTFMTTGAGMDSKGGSGGGGGGGGAFLRGAGETQLEMDRRLFGKKIQRLKREIDVVGEKRENFRRRRREREGLPLVAIIG